MVPDSLSPKRAWWRPFFFISVIRLIFCYESFNKFWTLEDFRANVFDWGAGREIQYTFIVDGSFHTNLAHVPSSWNSEGICGGWKGYFLYSLKMKRFLIGRSYQLSARYVRGKISAPYCQDLRADIFLVQTEQIRNIYMANTFQIWKELQTNQIQFR